MKSPRDLAHPATIDYEWAIMRSLPLLFALFLSTTTLACAADSRDDDATSKDVPNVQSGSDDDDTEGAGDLAPTWTSFWARRIPKAGECMPGTDLAKTPASTTPVPYPSGC